MKIRVTLKDPDGFYDSVKDAVDETIPGDMEEDEADALRDKRIGKAFDRLEKWVDCKEYLTVEFDLKAGTATVIEEGSES